MSHSTNNDVLLVTGAARGIGRAIAARMAAAADAPQTLLLADQDAEQLQEAAWQIDHPRIETLSFDVSVAAEVQQAFATIEAQHGPISRIAHAAGILTTGPLVEATDEDWHRVMAVNATGTFLVAKYASQQLLRNTLANRALVLVASNAAGLARSGMSLYAASKAASSALIRSLGLELAPHGIRCNTVCPGSTDTDMQRAFWGEDAAAGRRRVIEGDPENYRLGIPLRRIADADDIAHAVRFLLSEDAKHITMQDLYVDGGASLRA